MVQENCRYVRSVRLIKAKKMIENGDGNISEIAYSDDFSSPAYFSRCFKKNSASLRNILPLNDSLNPNYAWSFVDQDQS
jgi:hypothetical protein